MEKDTLQLKDFNMLSLIGIGNYAKVVLVKKKSSGKLYAMKIMKKKLI
jgi:serine/threonine protein kinase